MQHNYVTQISTGHLDAVCYRISWSSIYGCAVDTISRFSATIFVLGWWTWHVITMFITNVMHLSFCVYIFLASQSILCVYPIWDLSQDSLKVLFRFSSYFRCRKWTLNGHILFLILAYLGQVWPSSGGCWDIWGHHHIWKATIMCRTATMSEGCQAVRISGAVGTFMGMSSCLGVVWKLIVVSS